MNQYAEEWFEIGFILGPALRREKSGDLRKNVDWDELEQITFGAAMCAGCALMEKAGLKNSNTHAKNIFELRNAFVHNDFDISLNRNKKAYLEASNYLSNRDYADSLLKMDDPYYQLQGSKVVLNGGIYIAIQKCLM